MTTLLLLICFVSFGIANGEILDGPGIFILGGFTTGNHGNTAYAPAAQWYDPHNESMSRILNVQFPQTGGQAVVMFKNALYISGGDKNSKQLFKYSNGTITQLSNMTFGRSYHSAAVINNYIYVCGGVADDNKFLTGCSIYSITANYWTDLSSGIEGMPGGLAYAPALGPDWEPSITMVGGLTMDREKNATVPTDYLCRYSLGQGKYWYSIPALLTPSFGNGLVRTQQGMLSCGGYDGKQLIETCETNPEEDIVWTEMNDGLIIPRYLHQMVNLGEEVYVIGGQTMTGIFDKVELYSFPNQHSTMIGSKLKTPITKFAAVAVQEGMHI